MHLKFWFTDLQPRKYNKRKRSVSDSPTPPRSLYRLTPIPTPEPDRQSSLTPPPDLPCPEALQNIDIIRNVLRFVDRRTLVSALTVSTPFYMAAGPLFFRHVTLESSEVVIKIINQGIPTRTTRGHTKKTMTPHLFLKHTFDITLGFHLDSALPNDWISKLAIIIPNVRRAEIVTLPMDDCKSCAHNQTCKKTMWTLAAKLGVSDAFVHLYAPPQLSRYQVSSFGQPFALPTETPDSIHTITAIMHIRDEGWLDPRESFRASGLPLDIGIMEAIPHLQIILWWDTGVYINKMIPHERFSEINDWWEMMWRSHVPSMSQLAKFVTDMIDGSRCSWTFCMLSDLFPRECTFWPARIRMETTGTDTSVPEMVRRSLHDKINTDKCSEKDTMEDEPKISFRTRADLLRTPLPLGCPNLLVSRMMECHNYTAEDYGEATGLFGTWEM